MTNNRLAIKGKYTGYTLRELLDKYKKIEDKWIREEEKYQIELEEINKAIDSIR